jgi:hypothetical protein
VPHDAAAPFSVEFASFWLLFFFSAEVPRASV